MQRPPASWREVRLEEERFWVQERAGAYFIVGVGPAQGAGASADRLRTVLRASDLPLRAMRFGNQVHGRLIASLGEEPGRPFTGVERVGDCDGLMTDVCGLALAVWTADCVPVLLAGEGVVAAVHAGWRGAAAGIVRRAIRRFEVEYGVAALRVEAVLGPAVGSCHYEVGDEVLSALAGDGLPSTVWRRGQRVDLRDFLTAQLNDAGVERSAVQRIGPCTACDSELASYRRDGGNAGRQFAIVALCADRRPLS